MDAIYSILGGAVGAALVSGGFTLIQFLLTRKDRLDLKGDVHTKALRYLMLYIIQSRCEEYIRRGEITLQERRSIHHWHDLYHDGLEGNGDADLLMQQVDRLCLKSEDKE